MKTDYSKWQRVSFPGSQHSVSHMVCLVGQPFVLCFLGRGSSLGPGPASLLTPTVTNKGPWFPRSEYMPHFGGLRCPGFCPLVPAVETHPSSLSCGIPVCWSLPLVVLCLLGGRRPQVSPSLATDGDGISLLCFLCFCPLRGGENATLVVSDAVFPRFKKSDKDPAEHWGVNSLNPCFLCMSRF